LFTLDACTRLSSTNERRGVHSIDYYFVCVDQLYRINHLRHYLLLAKRETLSPCETDSEPLYVTEVEGFAQMITFTNVTLTVTHATITYCKCYGLWVIGGVAVLGGLSVCRFWGAQIHDCEAYGLN